MGTLRKLTRAAAAVLTVLPLTATAAQASVPVAQQFTVSAGAHPTGIAIGGDGNLWFAEPGIDKVGKLAPWGGLGEYATAPGVKPNRLVTAGDGALWFSEDNGSGNLGHINVFGSGFGEVAAAAHQPTKGIRGSHSPGPAAGISPATSTASGSATSDHALAISSRRCRAAI